jgi:hypothetical protein
MRSVSGFLADDGVFFDTKEDAELYEALHALEFSVKSIGADPAKFMIVIEGCQEQLRRYLDAKDSYEKSETIGPATFGVPNTEPDLNNANDGGTEGDARILEQPSDKCEYVPDVRGGVGAEDVPDRSPVDGARSGGAHARSVRSAAHLATTSAAALATARGSGGSTFVRQAEAGAKLRRPDV